MSDMDDRLRDLLRRKADDVPHHKDVPPSMIRRAHRRMAVNAAVVGGVALVLIVGVFAGFQAFAGSSPPVQPLTSPTKPAPHPTTSAHSPHPGSSHSPGTTPSPSPSSTPTGSTTPARCTVGHLQVKEFGSNGAMGSIRVEISMKNIGTSSCSLEGYPGMLLLSGTTPLHTDVVRGSSVVVPPITVRLVILAPGHVAAYIFGYSDVPTGNQTCPSSTNLEVTPPNAYNHATIPFQSTACGGVLTTSPVFPGTKVPSS